jgi:hypothetical protein
VSVPDRFKENRVHTIRFGSIGGVPQGFGEGQPAQLNIKASRLGEADLLTGIDASVSDPRLRKICRPLFDVIALRSLDC